MSTYDETYSQAGTARYVSAYGWDALLSIMSARYPHRELYAVSTDWFNHAGDIKVLKCRGARGDVLVRMA